jgi:tetratricopeptide (TPR) repeat protein
MNNQYSPPDLKKIGLFTELPAKRLDFLASKLKKQAFGPGEQIIRAGRSGRFLGIIESGEVTLEMGPGQSLTASSGQVFGSEMLLKGKPSEFTITARADTIIWVLDRSDWQAPSPPRPKYRPMLHVKKAVWITLVVTLALAISLITLGPSLLDWANNTLPDRMVEKGRADQAEDYLQFAVRLQPRSARLYGILGDILVLQEKDQKAIEIYEQALILDEYLPWIHNNLGVVLMRGDEIELAVEHFQSAIDLNPLNTTSYRNLGNAYYTEEKWGFAAVAYQEALELDFTLSETKAAWAGLILNERRLVEARLVWEDVLRTDPRHALALQGLGVVSLLEEDPGVAMLYFDAAQYLDPNDINMHLYIGMALEAMDRPSEAADQYQYVIARGSDPNLISLADTLLEIVLE